MKRTLVAATLIAMAGCASSSVGERPSDFRDGLGPDLRVFSDDACLPPAPARSIRTGPLDLAVEVVKGVAGLAVKSFGRYLEEVGSPEIETASGVHAAMFFDETSDPPVLNRSLRCLYFVRDGFQSKGFDRKAPDDLKQTWQRLGLTGTPSLYVMARLDPAEDGSDYFKASILDFTVQRYARTGAEEGRDYVVFMEFVVPSGGRQYRISANGEIAFDPVGPFARGGVPLRGAQRGQYLRTAELKGVETGWMTGPPRQDGRSRQPVNLHVDVVELKRGNPFIADLGRFLQSAPIANAAGEVAAEVVNQNGREQADIAAGIAAEKSERSLGSALESKILEIRSTLAERDVTKAELLSIAQDVEAAAANIEFQRRQKGWRSASPDQLLEQAKSLAGQARARLDGQ